MNTPLSVLWPIPRFRGKRIPLAWIQQIAKLQEDIASNCVSTLVTCISHVPLEKWRSMSTVEIRNILPSKPGPLKRFRAAKNRTVKLKFEDTLERIKQHQLLENESRTHTLEPPWAMHEACACCGKLLSFSTGPRNLTRRCPRPRDFDVQLLDTWSAQYDFMICIIDEIIAKLC